MDHNQSHVALDEGVDPDLPFDWNAEGTALFYGQYDLVDGRTPAVPDALDALLEDCRRKELGRRLEERLESLPACWAEAIRFRFGLADGSAHTMQETAERFGMTRERIRQIECRLSYRPSIRARRRLRDYLKEG